jgi:hypothetical protein
MAEPTLPRSQEQRYQRPQYVMAEKDFEASAPMYPVPHFFPLCVCTAWENKLQML